MDHARLQLPEPHLAGRLRNAVHLFAHRVTLHELTAAGAPVTVAVNSAMGYPPGPQVERLVVPSLGLVAADHAHQRIGNLAHGRGAGHPVDECGIGAERAAQPDVHRLFDVLVHVGDVPPEADVGDLRLRAGG